MTEELQKAKGRGLNYQYRVAKLVGGKVVGHSDSVTVGDKVIQIDRQHPVDVVNNWLGIECKHPKRVPLWLTKVMVQAVRNCPKGLLPVGWIGDRLGNHYVIIREQDWLDLHGK